MNGIVRPLLALAGLAGATGVAMGAFAAHALRARLDAKALGLIETGVHYHLVHAVGLLALAALAAWRPSGLVVWAGGLWTAGIVLFSGSLYVLALSGWRTIVYATPVGGVLFIAGWGLMVVLAVRGRPGT